MNGMSLRRHGRRSGLLALCLLTILATVAVPVTEAGADADTGLTEAASPTVLYGDPSTVVLTASNPSGAPEYNASFSDVLPVGVSYVPGSSSSEGTPLADPTIYADAPGPGQTTLVWPNVDDLQPASTLTLSFQLQADTGSGPHLGPNPILPGGTYTDATSVYVNSDPRTVPTFDATGAIVPGTYTDSAGASGTTQIVPVEVSLTQPWPQAEAVRGAHDHQYVNTLTVTNNPLYPTDSATAVAFVPAGLEFLGCGGEDNTTDASGTNPGSTDEYPGSGSLDVSAPLSPSVCPTPASVVTVTDPTEADGTVLSGVFTQVTWNIGDLGAAGVATIRYVTAIPLRSNTMTWSGATPPTTGAQGANLDNNNGAETYDGEVLTTYVQSGGTYTGPPGPAGTEVSAKGQTPVTAVDLAVLKSLSTTTLVPGQTVTVSLRYVTSEYRYSGPTVLTDTLPSGTCPVSTTANYATDSDAAECAPSSSYADPSIPFSSVVENADGSFLVTWELGTLPPDTDQTLTFTSLDRANYIVSGAPTTPVVAGDSLSDTSSIAGTTNATCFTGPPTAPTPDPDCTGSPTTPIYAGENTPGTPTHTSSATQTSGAPTLTKQVSAPQTPMNCATATYLTSTDPSYPPTYQDGDEVCFQLTMTYPVGVQTRNPVIYDLLPANTTLVSATPTSGNTVTIPGGNPVVSGQLIRWAVGDPVTGSPGLFAGGGERFQVDIEATVTSPPPAGKSATLTGNLAKATSEDTAGQATSLRDMADFTVSRPLLTLAKTSLSGGSPDPGQTVVAGQSVPYQVTLTNTGLQPAQGVEVWDNLPAQVTGTAPDDCPTLVDAAAAVPPATCATGTQLQWSGVTVPAATVVGGVVTPGTTVLTYSMTVPADVAPGATLTNHAGVVSYSGPPSNVPGPSPTYYPPSNIDPAAPSDPTTTTRADDTTSVVTPAVATAKSAVTSVTEPGNDALTQATVGELITYTVSATVPAGTTVVDGTLADPLGPGGTGPLDLVPGSASATLDGGPLPGGFVLTTADNTPTVTFPGTYGPDPSSAHTVTMTFTAQVNDVPANVAGAVIPNTAAFAYTDSIGATVTVPTPTVDITVVEPQMSLTKTDSPGGPYSPGATVDYTVTATNGGAADTSTAHDLVVVDTLPAGMTPITVPVNSISDGGVATESGGIWTITWTLPTTFTLAPGASKPLTFDATLPSTIIGSDEFTNTATGTITSLDLAGSPGARTTGGRYAATASDTVSTGGATITKTATPATTTIGVDTTYTATVTIPPDLDFPQATVIDTLPDGMTFDAYGTGSCVDADADPCGSDVVIAPIGTPTPTGSGTTALAWSLGNIDPDGLARTITLTYTAHPSKTYVSTGTKVTHGQTLVNDVGVYWQETDGPPPTSIPSRSTYEHASPTASATVTVVEPQLSITKTSSTANPTPGVPFTYTVTVTNATANSSCAYAPTVTDTVPAQLTNVSDVTTAQGTASAVGNAITWTPSVPSALCPLAAGLPPGAVATLTFQATLVASSGLTTGQTITNAASIASYYGVDPATATGAPSRYATYGPTNASVTVTPHFPIPVTTKTTPGGSAAVIGTPFAWSFTVTAPAPSAPAYSVNATDTLPAHWTYVPGSTTITPATGPPVTGGGADPTVATSGSVQTLRWTGAQLADLALAGQSVTVSYSATPGVGADLGSTPNTNSVVATAADATGATGNASGPYHSNTATANAFIAAADLAMAKSVGTVGGFVAGSSGNYFVLGVTNHGPSPAAAPVVTDTVPGGATWTFASASGSGWACTTTPSTLTCTGTAALASGATAAPIDAYVTVPADNGTTPVSNTASVSSTTYDPDTSNNAASVVAPVTTSADLGIVKTHVGPLVPGEQGTYTLTVTNNGPSDAAAPVVSDTLPSGLTFVSATGTGWLCGDVLQSVTCSATGPLAAGATAGVITVVVAIAPGTTGTITNTATVASATPDPVPTNNSSTDSTAPSPAADLSITKVHTGAVTAGQDVTYQLTVANAGPSVAASPVVTDVLPSGLTFVSASGPGWSCSFDTPTSTLTCVDPVGIGAGSTAPRVTVVALLASAATGTVANTATVASTTPDPDPSNNSSTDTAPITTSADLAITKVHTATLVAGGTVTYTLTVTDSGPSDAVAPTVTDALPADLTYVSAGGVGWTCTFDAPSSTITCTATGGLGAGSSGVITVVTTLAPDATGTLTNTASVTSATPDPDPANNSSTDTGPVTQSADVSIVKTHDPADTFTPGTIATYDLAVTNDGPSDAASPVVVDPLPTSLTYIATTAPGWTVVVIGQLVTLTLDGPLAAGASAPPIAVQVRVAPDYLGDVFSNTATVTSTTPDPDPSNNSSTDVSPNPNASADLSIVKTASGPAVAGSPLAYSLVVANAGPSDALNPVVTDTLPPELTYVSATGPGWSCSAVGQTVTCDAAAPLPTGTTAGAITLTAGLDPGATGTVANTATVASTTDDPDPSDNSSTATVPVTTSADLAITKTHTGDFVVDQNATYTLTVDNLGPSDADAPVVTDALPAGLTFVSASGTGWTCSADPATGPGQTVTCTSTSALAATANAAPISLVVAVGAPAYPGVTNTASVSSTTPDPVPGNNSASDPAVVSPLVDLQITKTIVGSTTVSAGNELAYDLSVTNSGPTSDPGPVVVTDPLPTGLAYVSAAGPGWTCTVAATPPGRQTVTCTRAGAFGVGVTSAIALTTRVATDVTTMANTATVASSATDLHPSNNSSTATATVTPGAELVITKSLVGGALTSGRDATYDIAVTNDGPSPAADVVVSDPLPPGLGFVSAGGTGWTCGVSTPTPPGQVVTCTLSGGLADGSTAVITLVADVLATSGTIANSATVSSSTTLTGSSVTRATTAAATVAPPTPGGGSGSGGSGGTTGASGGLLAVTGIDVVALLLAAGLLLVTGGLLTYRRRRVPR
jgi:uncharacterized repeat protein (TIGR01451 family)/fimbrial isopeptide formation D2 family protein